MPARMTVLVVEDEPLILMDLCDFLSDLGFDPVACGSADRAAELLALGLLADALVTDVDMPGLIDGIALAQLVSSRYPSMQVVVTSGRSSAADRVPPGATFIPKPCDPAAIAGRLSAPVAAAA